MRNVLTIAFAIILFSNCAKEKIVTPTTEFSPEFSQNSDQDAALNEVEEGIRLFFELKEPNQQLYLFRNADGTIDWDVEIVKNTRRTASKKHTCEGGAIAVAKCAKAIIDAGGCVISGETDGVYWSDRIACP